MGARVGIRSSTPALAGGKYIDEASEVAVDFYNNTGGTLTPGTLVYLSSFHTASGLRLVTKADGNVASRPATYVVPIAVANSAAGILVRKTNATTVTSFDTSGGGVTVGDPVYLSDTAGTPTLSAASSSSGQKVGVVATKANPGKVLFDIEGSASGTAGGTAFFDSEFVVMDETDPTKKAKIDVGSNVATGNTRTYKAPNASGTLTLLELAQAWTAEQTFGGNAAFLDGDLVKFGTGIDVTYTPDGTDLVVTGAGKTRYADSVVLSFGAGDDLQVSSDGTNAVFTGSGVGLWHDTKLVAADPVDTTKRARIDAGAVTAGQTRVISAADRDVDLDHAVQRAFVTIATAAVKTLNATPVQLVAAPGAGKYIEAVSIHWWLDFATVGYDAAAVGDTLEAKYTNGAGAAVVDAVAGNAIGAAAADYHVTVQAVPEVIPVANAAIVAHINVGEWFAAAGDSPLKAEVFYRVRAFEPA